MTSCGLRYPGHRAPASHILSQSPLSFPKQTHYDFRNLVTYLRPLFSSPCAIRYFWGFFWTQLQYHGEGWDVVLGCGQYALGSLLHHVAALGLRLLGMWLEDPFLPFQSCVPNSSEIIPQGQLNISIIRSILNKQFLSLPHL